MNECYPNCPKYIQRREFSFIPLGDDSQKSSEYRSGELLHDEQIAWIGSADTFFVGSAHPDRGLDASHRGGPPGFVEVIDNCTLRIPDYVGNSMYNTLGNFLMNAKAGLVFVDFDRSHVLQLIGEAEIIWSHDDTSNRTGGTRRFWDFHVRQWRESAIAGAVRSEFLDYSPHNPNLPTG